MGRTSCYFAPSVVLTFCCLGIRASAGPTLEPNLTLIVGLSDYAGVPEETLVHSKEVAAKILGQAGIQVRWVDCPLFPGEMGRFPACSQAAASGGHYLRVLPQSMAARHEGGMHRFGYGVPPHFAYVFAGKAHRLSKDVQVSLPVILGFVIAHELGHLLLPAEPHSGPGIMSEDLALEDLRRAEAGILLTFSAEQAQRMRNRLQQEMLAKN